MNRTTRGILWMALYVALALSPLLVILIGPQPAGRDFWREFSVALAFVGLAVMCLQFLITARFRRITAPYGIDILLQFHRRITWVALGLVLAHPVILFWHDSETLALLNPLTAPWRARLAVLAVVALLLLTATSIWREQLKLGYEAWRLLHGILAVVAVAGAVGHAVGVGYYLSDPWKAALWSLLIAGVILLVLYVRLAKPVLLRHHPYTVSAVRPERGDSATLELKPSGHEGLRFRPGQFAWIRVGTSPVSIRENPFSFSGSAEDHTRLSFTIKALGDFTNRVKDLSVGERAYVDGPYGVFTPDYLEHDKGFVLIAGGIGITPIMSMLRTLADQGDTRPILLIYANKTWEDVTFREEIEALPGRLRLQTVHVLDEAPQHLNAETGHVTDELLHRYLPAERTSREYFVCGPPPMMDAVQSALLKLRVPLTHVHMEQFQLV